MTASVDASSDYEDGARFPGYPAAERETVPGRARVSIAARPDAVGLAVGVAVGLAIAAVVVLVTRGGTSPS